MIEFILQHQSLAALVAYWIFSAAVSALPDPGPGGSPGYLWLYRFSHTIAGNLTTAFLTAARYRASASRGSRIPGLKGIGLILIFPLLFSASACAALSGVHPGALNPADLAAYDALLIAETTIDQARLDFQSGQLPDKATAALDLLVQSYNVARDSWLTYRGAISSNTPDQIRVDQLSKNILDLTTAIKAFKEAK
jgi:hypothetical protein